MTSIFGENFGLKVISLGLALLLEVYFYSPDNSVVANLPAGVDLIGLPPSTMVVEPPEGTRGMVVQVQVRGPRPIVDQVRSVQQRFRVSPPPGAGSNFTLVFNPSTLSLPAGVEVLNIEPDRVRIQTEREAKKELLVIADKIGTPPEGYQVDQIEVFPDTVVVRGPMSRIEVLQAVETEPVDVSNLTDRARMEVSLKPLGEMVSPSVTMVAVDVKVNEVPQERTISAVNVQVLAPSGFAATVQPTKATAVIGGPPSMLQELAADSFSLTADGRGLGEGRHSVPLTADLPKGVSIIKTNPAKVAVFLSTTAAE